MMNAFANLFNSFTVKGFQIIRPATCHQAIINHHLFINPIGAGVFKIGL